MSPCYAIYFLNFDPKSRNLLPFFGLKLQIKPLQTIQKNKNVPKPPKSGTYSNKHNTIFLLLWQFPMLRQIYLREYLKVDKVEFCRRRVNATVTRFHRIGRRDPTTSPTQNGSNSTKANISR